jgi:hypothetical protein
MYYSSLSPLQRNMNKIQMSGIAQAGCVSKVFDFKEFILWCINKFDNN